MRINYLKKFSYLVIRCRVATGENWPNIMLACTSPARCDKSLPAVEKDQELCGTDLAYLYFISFVFLCSFLVSCYLYALTNSINSLLINPHIIKPWEKKIIAIIIIIAITMENKLFLMYQWILNLANFRHISTHQWIMFLRMHFLPDTFFICRRCVPFTWQF